MPKDAIDVSIPVALQNFVETSHRLLLDRLDLLRLDMKVWVQKSVKAVAYLLLSSFFVLGFWIMLMATTVLLLERWLPKWGAFLCITMLHLLLALIFLKMVQKAGTSKSLSSIEQKDFKNG